MRYYFPGKCSWSKGSVTGGDQYVSALHHALVSRGESVSVLSDPDFPIAIPLPTPLVNLWSLSLNGWYAAQLRSFRGSVIVEDFTSRARLFLFNPVVRAITGAPVVALVQGFYHANVDSAVMERLERGLARTYLRGVDLVIANSEATKTEVVRLGAGEDRVKVVQPGVDETFLRLSPEPRHVRNSPVNVLFVGGQCKPIKGLDYLIKALALMDDPGIRLTLVGEASGETCGPYVRRLEALLGKYGIGHRVRFAGRAKTSSELHSHYRKADLLVLPSLWEGFGIAAIEAMCHGLPVVATRAGGITEIVQPGKNGILVPPRDAKSLAGAIGRIAGDESLWRQMSRSAAERARSLRRGWREVTAECLAHIEEMLVQRGACPARMERGPGGSPAGRSESGTGVAVER